MKRVCTEKCEASFKETKTVFYDGKSDDEILEKEFDFNKAVKNPYAKGLKKDIVDGKFFR